MFNAVVYDCEIEKAIPKRKEQPLAGISYCLGWRDFANMGIACVGAYDYKEQRFRVFCKDNLSDFEELVSNREHIISFNGYGFDDLLLQAYGLNVHSTFDLLAAMQKTGRYKSGYSLDRLAAVNLGMKKSDLGALAPINWQQGRIGSVIDYCLNDVDITRRLINMLPTLHDPNDMAVIQVEVPWDIERTETPF